MFEVEIDRNICKGCGACVKTSQILYLDEENLICMNGAVIEDNIVEGIIANLYEIETAASICPEDCFTIYDDDGDEVEIERNANL